MVGESSISPSDVGTHFHNGTLWTSSEDTHPVRWCCSIWFVGKGYGLEKVRGRGGTGNFSSQPLFAAGLYPVNTSCAYAILCLQVYLTKRSNLFVSFTIRHGKYIQEKNCRCSTEDRIPYFTENRAGYVRQGFWKEGGGERLIKQSCNQVIFSQIKSQVIFLQVRSQISFL